MFGALEDPFQSSQEDQFDMFSPFNPPPEDPNIFPLQQQLPCEQHVPIEPEYSETETESEVPTFYGIASDCPDILCTDVAHMREVIASRTFYPGFGQLGKWLKNQPGLIILPLHAISLIRTPLGGHIANPKVIIFHPTKSKENYSQFPQFQECMRKFYY